MSEEKQNNENVENEVTQKEQPSEVEQVKQELEELTDRYKRVMAEFENYKKRAQKDRESLYGRTLSDVIEIILPVLDNLENAAKAETQDASYKQGVEMVLKQFKAVSSVDDPNAESQKIVQEYRKGYKFGSKVIRHSMVVVNN